MDLYGQIQLRLLNLKVGDSIGGFTIVSRTPKRIKISDKDNSVHTINIKNPDGFVYLDCKKIGQILRDMEGFEIMKIHDYCKNF